MVLKRSVFLIAAFFFSSCCFAQIQADGLHIKLFTVQQLQQDLDSLHLAVKTNHPDLWRNTDSATSEKKWKLAKEAIRRPMKRWDFIEVLSPLLGQYKDGHTYITSFDFEATEVEEMINRNGKIFPWELALHNDEVWVIEDMGKKTGNIKGLRLESVNGVSIQTICKTLMPLMAGDYKENTEATLSKFFSFFLWAHYGWQNEFTITTTDVAGKSKIFQVEGIDINRYLEKRFPKNDWTMEVYEPAGIAIIECRNYRNQKAAERFIDSAFEVIKEKNIRHLAFDIRRNGGGNSAIGDYLLSYITDKRYTDAVSKTIKDGSMIRAFKEGSWVNKMLLHYKNEGVKDGDLYTLTFSPREPRTVRFPQNKFKGKFYLITGPATYSSAHMTAMAVKCFQLGTIIGQPTGEQINLTGESFGYILPNTKLNASCATAVYKSPCGNPAQMGVQPDLVVPFNKNDLMAGIDSEIEALKQFAIFK